MRVILILLLTLNKTLLIDPVTASNFPHQSTYECVSSIIFDEEIMAILLSMDASVCNAGLTYESLMKAVEQQRRKFFNTNQTNIKEQITATKERNVTTKAEDIINADQNNTNNKSANKNYSLIDPLNVENNSALHVDQHSDQKNEKTEVNSKSEIAATKKNNINKHILKKGRDKDDSIVFKQSKVSARTYIAKKASQLSGEKPSNTRKNEENANFSEHIDTKDQTAQMLSTVSSMKNDVATPSESTNSTNDKAVRNSSVNNSTNDDSLKFDINESKSDKDTGFISSVDVINKQTRAVLENAHELPEQSQTKNDSVIEAKSDKPIGNKDANEENLHLEIKNNAASVRSEANEEAGTQTTNDIPINKNVNDNDKNVLVSLSAGTNNKSTVTAHANPSKQSNLRKYKRHILRSKKIEKIRFVQKKIRATTIIRLNKKIKHNKKYNNDETKDTIKDGVKQKIDPKTTVDDSYHQDVSKVTNANPINNDLVITSSDIINKSAENQQYKPKAVDTQRRKIKRFIQKKKIAKINFKRKQIKAKTFVNLKKRSALKIVPKKEDKDLSIVPKNDTLSEVELEDATKTNIPVVSVVLEENDDEGVQVRNQDIPKINTIKPPKSSEEANNLSSDSSEEESRRIKDKDLQIKIQETKDNDKRKDLISLLHLLPDYSSEDSSEEYKDENSDRLKRDNYEDQRIKLSDQDIKHTNKRDVILSHGRNSKIDVTIRKPKKDVEDSDKLGDDVEAVNKRQIDDAIQESINKMNREHTDTLPVRITPVNERVFKDIYNRDLEQKDNAKFEDLAHLPFDTNQIREVSINMSRERYNRTMIAFQTAGERALEEDTRPNKEIAAEMMRLFNLLPPCIQAALKSCKPNSDNLKRFCEDKNSNKARKCQANDLSARLECNSNETFINGACYRNCPEGFKDMHFYCQRSDYILRSSNNYDTSSSKDNAKEIYANINGVTKCTEFGSRDRPAGLRYCKSECPEGYLSKGSNLCEKPYRFANQEIITFVNELVNEVSV